ncbi:MAG: hypothetical protein RI948_982 [Bacteroidota bacterium]|jgi:hypothetical protein
MKRSSILRLLLFTLCNLFGLLTFAQQNLRSVALTPDTLVQVLDSNAIYTPSFHFSRFANHSDTIAILENAYSFDPKNNTFQWKDNPKDSIYLRFLVFPFAQRQTVLHYPFTPISPQNLLEKEREKFQITTRGPQDLFGGNAIHKSGSLARGIGFGNNQSLGLNSALNLQLNGQISPGLMLTASLSDANIPFQASGTTNQLREFDQVFIQVHNEQLKVTAGDFWLDKPDGQFLTYRKRAQGITGQYNWQLANGAKLYTQSSLGLSKGKFQRQIIQGLEAVQGPYRLVGSNNEPYILILAGTERIYIDGQLLQRGQEFDYIIDYASAELTFTSRHLITKDSRIVAEFQYADQNFARSLLQHTTRYQTKQLKTWVAVYQEQDLKNQALQQILTAEQLQQLSQIGDNLAAANVQGFDSSAYLENTNMYRLVDTLGYQDVLVFSVDAQLAHYRSTFTDVGTGQGDYILAGVSASGNYYKWIAPINGSSQGNFAPIRRVQTPKRKQMASAGISYDLHPNWSLFSENALSENDLNLYSSLDDQNNLGFASKGGLRFHKALSQDSSRSVVETSLEYLYLNARFEPIEQFRAVEFDRDWNIRNQNYTGTQRQLELKQRIAHNQFGQINIVAQHLDIDSLFSGQRLFTDGNWKQKGWSAKWDASALRAQTTTAQNYFVRHRLKLDKQLGLFKIGYIDDHEWNQFSGSLLPNSYQFYDAQAFIQLQTTRKLDLKLFYRERYDWRADSLLQLAAKAKTTGLELKWDPSSSQNLQVLLGARQLAILDSTLIDQKAEKSLVARFDYNARFFKNALTLTTFYEIGSGLEQKRRFQYVRVNDGQGIYAWIDYNADGIKDLNEFEQAIYVDQANYIRVFVPSASYAAVFSNEWNQSVLWRPELLWRKREGALGVLAKFSNQTRIRVQRKLQDGTTLQWLNPLASDIAELALQSANAQFSNSLFFNRNAKVFSAEYSWLKQENKMLLASGYDARSQTKNQLNLRLNVNSQLAIETTLLQGQNAALADYTTGRNFQITQQELKPQLIYQDGSQLRLSLIGSLGNKTNSLLYGGETAKSKALETTWKINRSEKGSLNGSLKYVYFDFNGTALSAVGYEMLEGLRPGTNWTWSLSFQKIVGKNLQLSLNYGGRLMQGQTAVHTGGMELRAYF